MTVSDGDFRRPPQLWEQKLAALVSASNVGAISGGATQEVPVESPPGDGGPGGEEPVPTPAPGRFSTPSTPVLTGCVQGIMVAWDGKNSSGDLYPYESAVVEIHFSTSSGFTPSSTTLRGSLRYPGYYTVTGLTAGTTYYVKLRGLDAAGNYSPASAQASGQPGATSTNDYGTGTITENAVSFNARAIGGITTTVGSTAPSSPLAGDIWLDNSPLTDTITSATGNGTSITYTASGHPFAVNDLVTITGTSSSSFNRTNATVTAATATTFTITAAVSGSATGGTATGPTRGMIQKRYSGSAWVVSDWGPDMLSANVITAKQIAAGAITAGAIVADAIDGKTITGATVRSGSSVGPVAGGQGVIMDTSGLRGYDSSGNQTINVNASTGAVGITGSLRTGSSGARVEMGSLYGALSAVNLYTSAGAAGSLITDVSGGILLGGAGGTKPVALNGSSVEVTPTMNLAAALNVDGTATMNGALTAGLSLRASASGANDAFRVSSSGGVYAYGVNDNTTTSAANVRCGGSAQLLLSTSSIRRKTQLAPLADGLVGVPAEKLSADPASVDPYDVLTITPTEFESMSEADAGARMLGFIAEDVVQKFPWAAEWDDEGQVNAVSDRPILAALLQVVKDQQATIAELTARVEALEAK